MLKLITFLILLQGFELYSQQISYSRSIVNTLASEKYQGRAYTGKADLMSAKFIRNEFRNHGILPVSNSYFQHFRMDANTFPGKMEIKVNKEAMMPGTDYLVDPSSPSLKGKFKVFYLSRPDLLAPDKFQQVIASATGNAILIDIADTFQYNKGQNEEISRLINEIKYNPVYGNVLTIIYTDKKLVWSISDRQSEKPVITFGSNTKDPSRFREVEVNLVARFKKDYKTQNVAGIIPGRSIPDSFLVITAHYDHLGIMGKNTIFPGANDNASGVAMMLSLGKYFVANPPEYSILLIAFSGEEMGLKGSEFYVQHPLTETSKIKFLVNFDLAGTGEEGIKVVNASVYKSQFDILKSLNDQHQFLHSVQPRGEACISDHCFFYLNQVPCFYIYTLGGISAYHDVFDRSETLPLTEFENYLELMISFFKSI